MNITNWNWNQHYSYSWGYWFGRNPNIVFWSSADYDPFWWKGFVNGTIDYELKKRGLK